MVLYMPNVFDRERLVSAILTLRQFVIPNTGYIDQLSVLVNAPLDFSFKVYFKCEFKISRSLDMIISNSNNMSKSMKVCY